MVEYLYDAIRAVAGQEIKIHALITDETEEIITEGCSLVIHQLTGEELYKANGNCLDESLMWEFTIPAEVTTGLQGRYWYCIQHNNSNLCFKQPIYLM